MADSLDRLFKQVLIAREIDPARSRTARLMRAGHGKMAKKLAEEASEVVIEAIKGKREALTRESADLLYHLVVLWAACGVRPQDIWDEMDRREAVLGMAEKVPKGRRAECAHQPPVRRKLVALDMRHARKWR